MTSTTPPSSSRRSSTRRHAILDAMLRRKPLLDAVERTNSSDSHDNHHHHHLKRTLTAADLMLYGVGCSVGAGIYCLVGIGADLAGPGISLSFLICGCACMFTSVSYAEFAARFPTTGSAYIYAYIAFNEFTGWLIGWMLTLGYGFTAAVVARSWASYLYNFFAGESTHNYFTKLPIPFLGIEDYTCSPLATLIIAICTLVLVSGTKESSKFNNFMTVLNISVLLFVIVVGSESISMENLLPFAPHGMNGIARGAGLVFYAFIGFDMVACLSEEVVQPEINMPLGIVGSLVISAGIYVSVSLAVIGMAPTTLLGGDTPLTNALLANACCTQEEQLSNDAAAVCLNSACTTMQHRFLAYSSRFVSFGAIFGLTSGTFTSLMGQPRIFYGMAQDGLLMPIFGKVDPTTHVPTAGIVITGIVTALLACFVDLEALANMISLGTLMVFTFVDAGVIILRWSPASDAGEVLEPLESHAHASRRITARGPEWLQKIQSKNVHDNGSKPILCTLVFTGAWLFGTIAVTNGWNASVTVWLCGLLAVGSTLYLMILPRSPPPETFSCPGVPVVPLIGIASNSIMMGSLPASSWAFTLTWVMIGVVVYFSYGIRHSKLGKGILRSSGSLSFSEYDPLVDQNGGSRSTLAYDSTSTRFDEE